MASKDNSTFNQRKRLLERLRRGPCTTIQARHELDIMGVAPRIHELRYKFGHNIHTDRIESVNPGGGKHCVAQYVLLSGKWQGARK